MICRVCNGATGEPVYVSSEPVSLTSMSTILKQGTEVHVCRGCGHVQTPPLEDLDEYYSSTYEILIDSEEEDQIYEIRGDQTVFRADHQADVLLGKADLPQGARVLDYGAAKGATVRQVLSQRGDLQPCFFDVTDRYARYWTQIVAESQCASGSIPGHWFGTFDLVTSFFVLEHVDEPQTVLGEMVSLLRPGGRVHLVLPNIDTNPADFIVVDHINHFTGSSLSRALGDAGFCEIEVDGDSHVGAWVVSGRRPLTEPVAPLDQVSPEGAVSRALELAEYWRSAGEAVRVAEDLVGEHPAAIYGAGFYGTFITVNLRQPDRIVAYVDRNPYLQGSRHHGGKEIIAPADLPAEVTDVYVGLNPRSAAAAIGDVSEWSSRPLRFHYL